MKFPQCFLKRSSRYISVAETRRDNQGRLLVIIWLDFSPCFEMLASILEQDSDRREEASMEKVRLAYNKPQASMKYHSQSFNQNMDIS